MRGFRAHDTFFSFKNKDNWQEDNVAEVNLKKLSRAELLEMMITFSEETEAAKKREAELRESFEKERLQLQSQMAEERAQMLKGFDEEKAEMRAKFAEQKAQLQAGYEKDIEGLKARLQTEKQELQSKVDDSLAKIENSKSLAEASLMISGVMEAAQKAADLYVETLKKSATKEHDELLKEIEEYKKRIALLEEQAKEKAEASEKEAEETEADKAEAAEPAKEETGAEEAKAAEPVKEKTGAAKSKNKKTSKKVTEETDE